MHALIAFALNHRRPTVIAVVIVLAACISILHRLNVEPTPNVVPASAVRGDTVTVTAEQMHQLSVVKVEALPFRIQKTTIGQIAFNEDTSTLVFTPYSGRVTRLIAKLGDKVKRGDPLLEIDSQDVLQTQNDFIAAITAMKKARSQLDLAQVVETRAHNLYDNKAGPLKEWQQAQAQLTGAQNNLRLAETALDAAHNRLHIIGRSDDEISALAETGTVSRTIVIDAPINGTVVARKVGPGQFVRADFVEALYSIADLSTMWLKAFVPESDIPQIRLGQELDISVGAMPGRVFKARVTAIGAASDAMTRRVVVRSEISNPDSALKSEMFANFRIATGDPQVSPAAPVEAVIRAGDDATIWVERKPMLFERRLVTIGLEEDGRIQVTSGLRGGERIVTRGAIFVDNEWRQ